MNKKLPVEIENLISKLNKEQLIQLNHKIVERIKLMEKVKNLHDMANFNIGDKVCFTFEGETLTGRIIRLNQKTVSIITENDQKWNVAPGFLTKIVN